MLTVDARGRSCPEPVILLRKALKDKPEACEVLVDNAAAKENCTRFARHGGYEVSVRESAGVYTLRLTR